MDYDLSANNGKLGNGAQVLVVMSLHILEFFNPDEQQKIDPDFKYIQNGFRI